MIWINIEFLSSYSCKRTKIFSLPVAHDVLLNLCPALSFSCSCVTILSFFCFVKVNFLFTFYLFLLCKGQLVLLLPFFFYVKIRHSTDREVALMILMAYLSYMLAEVRFPTTSTCRVFFVFLIVNEL